MNTQITTTRKEIDYLNRPMTIKEIVPVTKNLSKKKSPRLNGTTDEFCQTL